MSETKREYESVAVNATARSVARIPFGEWERMVVEVENVGANALTAFAVKVVPHENADSYTIADESTHFADANLIGCIDPAGDVFNPTAMAAATKCMLVIPRNGCRYAEIHAASSSGTSLDIRWGGR